MHLGPKIVRDGLVFGYDTGYGIFDNSGTYRFNLGEPATNSQDYDKTVMTQTGFDAWGCYDGNNSSPAYHSWDVAQSKTLVNIKGPDNSPVNAMLYHNFTGGFHGPTHWSGVPSSLLTNGSKITLQGWVKAADPASIGKTVSPYLYYSKIGGGAYSNSTSYTLTGEWQLVSHSYTVPEGSTGNGIMYFFTSGGTDIKMYLTKTAIVGNKTYAVQWLPGGTTRSVSGSLIDLTKSTNIDVSNVSFDSDGLPTFDGTDDTISVTSYSAIELVDNVSIEAVYKRLSTDPILDVIANKYHSTGWELFCRTDNTFSLAGRNGDGTYYYTSNPAYTVNNNKYYHLVGLKEGLSWRLYVNGELYAYLTANSVGTWSNTGILQIGGEGNGYYPNMELPVLKVYNRVLSAQQVQQNYKAYKNRFNI